jgi:hypothetical protein
MDEDESIKSFFNLCNFKLLRVGDARIEHNLDKWNLDAYDSKVDRNDPSKIVIKITLPYTEMNLDVVQKDKDPDFFGKRTARLSISNNVTKSDGWMSYLTGKTSKITINANTEYLIFDSPYFYPHNSYYLLNKSYLHKKIMYSVNFINYFVEAYKRIFQSGVPLIYIKDTRETRDYYEIDIILKEYFTISYVKTDLSTSTMFFHMLLDSSRKSNLDKQINSKYHQITVSVPRTIRTGNVYFKFTANSV